MSCPVVVRVGIPSGPAVVRLTVPGGPKVVRVVTPGPPGIQGPIGPQPEAYVHQQVSASATWTINHNLGYNPSVEIMNAANREIDGDVYHININQTIVMFNVPVAGTARLT